MGMRELYDAIGVEYDDVLALLRREDRIELYFTQMMDDPSFGELERTMEERDYPAAFRAAHTIKGMCVNLMIEPLAKASIALVECLRSDPVDEAEATSLYAQVRNEHNLLLSRWDDLL